MTSWKISKFLLLFTLIPIISFAQSRPGYFELAEIQADLENNDEQELLKRVCMIDGENVDDAFAKDLAEGVKKEYICPSNSSTAKFCECIAKKFKSKVTKDDLETLATALTKERPSLRLKDDEHVALLLQDEMERAKNTSTIADLLDLNQSAKDNLCTVEVMLKKINEMPQNGCKIDRINTLLENASLNIAMRADNKPVEIFGSYADVQDNLKQFSTGESESALLEAIYFAASKDRYDKYNSTEMKKLNDSSILVKYFEIRDGDGSLILGKEESALTIDLTDVFNSKDYDETLSDGSANDSSLSEIAKVTMVKAYMAGKFDEFKMNKIMRPKSRCDSVASTIVNFCKKPRPSVADYIRDGLINNPTYMMTQLAINGEGTKDEFFVVGALQCHLANVSTGLVTSGASNYIKSTQFFTPINKPDVGIFTHDYDEMNSIQQLLSGIETDQDQNITANNKLYNDVAAAQQIEKMRQSTKQNNSIQETLKDMNRSYSSGNYDLTPLHESHKIKSKTITQTMKSSEFVEKPTIPTNTNTAVAPQVVQQALPASFTPTVQSSVQASAPKKVAIKAPEVVEEKKEKMTEDSVSKRLLDMLEEKNKTQTAQSNSASMKVIEELRREVKELREENNRPKEVAASVSTPTAELKKEEQISSDQSFGGFTGSTSSGSSLGGTSNALSSGGVASSGVAAMSSAGADAKSGGQSRSSIESSDGDGKRSLASFSGSKGSGSGSFQSGGSSSSGGAFALTKEEVDVNSDFIVDERSFKSNDSSYIENIYKKTGGKPIYLEQVNEFGDEVYVMMEAVKDEDGKISYVPVSKEEIESGKYGQNDEEKKEAPSLMDILNGNQENPKQGGDRIKAVDLNELINIGEKL